MYDRLVNRARETDILYAAQIVSAGWGIMMEFEDDEQEQAAIRERLEELRIEHRDLDVVIDRLVHDPHLDQIRLSRMKKRKLLLKDMITKYESKLIPDLNA
jgi:hypothetical protein